MDSREVYLYVYIYISLTYLLTHSLTRSLTHSLGYASNSSVPWTGRGFWIASPATIYGLLSILTITSSDSGIGLAMGMVVQADGLLTGTVITGAFNTTGAEFTAVIPADGKTMVVESVTLATGLLISCRHH